MMRKRKKKIGAATEEKRKRKKITATTGERDTKTKKANLCQKRRVNSIPMLKVNISSDNKKMRTTVSENPILSFDNTTSELI